MKRPNPATGQPFRYGDTREDGYRFEGYQLYRKRKDGTFFEVWRRPDGWEDKRKQRMAINKVNGQKMHAKRREWLDQIKLQKGCADCGYNQHPAALDFDHRDGEAKLFNISARLTRSWDSILAEVNKCDVVCACCHRIRTHEGNHYHSKRVA